MRQVYKIILIGLLLNAGHAVAQSSVMSATAYKVSIKGTSNLHPWDEKVGKVTASANVNRGSDGSIIFNALDVVMDVYSIKSTEGHIMDNNTYKALKASQYPQIRFVLAAPTGALNVHDGAYTFPAKGKLTIAGVTHDVDVNVKLVSATGQVTFEGSEKIRMTDYNITPPTAMFGMLKTGDDITIDFNLVFSGALL